MTLKMKKYIRSRRCQVIVLITTLFVVVYYTSISNNLESEANYDLAKRKPAILATTPAPKPFNLKHRETVVEYIETSLQEALKIDKGTGCEVPKLDPFDKDIMAFDKEYPKVVCKGQDWVKCYLHECRVIPEILSRTKNIKCTYRDILYENDSRYTLGPPTVVVDDRPYILNKSDHVKIKCVGKHEYNESETETDIFPSKWSGHATGFRTLAPNPPIPPEREDSINILIFGFDSTSKNGFIRKMPKSYEYLKEKLGAIFLNAYNILGDGTPAALFPILSGKNELEFPDARRKNRVKEYLNADEFIFNLLKKYGYQTAYYEDSPWIGTFQYRFNGFNYQPADHYLRAFLQEDHKSKTSKEYCVGDTPLYKIMMNITDQLPGKRYCFTFIADICHDDFNRISTADDDTVAFLQLMEERGVYEDTLVFVMGDHGSRYANVRQTIQGKYEERLPLMAILVPPVLTRARPDVLSVLKNNTHVLTTPHDIHTTVLDALDLMEFRSKYRVGGADLDRGLSLLRPIPANRSCSEAGIQAHWCTCTAWNNVSSTEHVYNDVAQAFVDFINELTEPFRSQCVPRTLKSISWVMRQRANNRLISFVASADNDGYTGKFDKKQQLDKEQLQLKVTVGPSDGIFEASVTYLKDKNKYIFNTRDISRTNMYHNEPECISATHPELNMFCYCKNQH